ncbi:MAG: VWA domain-containing protein [Vicinamibacterales bacterium]
MARPAALVCVMAALAGLLVHAQEPQQPPAFRAGTEAVAIYATVLNRGGEMVLDLQRDDFTVYDNGRRQDLTVFERGLQPVTAALLIDTSASMTLNLDLARTAAEQFVIRMLPRDRVRVGSFSDRVDLSPEFTADRDALLVALRETLHIGNPTRLWDAVDTALTALAPLSGRRVLVLMTDGVDTASRTTPDVVLTRSHTQETMTYVVRFRTTQRAVMAELPLSPSASQVFSGTSARSITAGSQPIQQLARQSGGGYFTLMQYDDVNTTFTHLMQELHYQYVLGFTPQRLDGKVHELDVRVTRPGVTVRARQHYLAAERTTGQN